MSHLRHRASAALLLPLLLMAGCTPPDVDPDPRPSLVATVFPVADLTARLAGPGVRVTTLLPPRASPDTWEVTPAQIRAIQRARGAVSVGAGLDAWVRSLLPAETPHLMITAGMELRESDHDHPPGEAHSADEAVGDPHVWLDPLRVRDEVLPALEDFLAALFPESARELEARRAALSDSLTALDREVRAILEDAEKRGFVATHEAWGYFAQAYGLESVGSLYERPGHEPSARGLARLVRSARADGIDAVLAEPQLATTAAEALAAEIGGRVVVVDPLGGPGMAGRESYFDMMRFNALAFREALGGP